MSTLLDFVNQEQQREGLPRFGAGDTVRVHVRVVEGGRERAQALEGIVMRYHGSGGPNTRFTVRRVSHGVGVERTFLLHSPRLERIDVIRRGKVRRAQLNYLRGLVGRAARIKERRVAPAEKSARA